MDPTAVISVKQLRCYAAGAEGHFVSLRRSPLAFNDGHSLLSGMSYVKHSSCRSMSIDDVPNFGR